MLVAIDIRRVRDFGAGTYTRNLVSTLARLDRSGRYLLVGTQSDYAEFRSLPENFSLLEFDRHPDGLRQDLELAWKLERQRATVWHTPYLVTPWVRPCQHVVTVHDIVEFLEHPPANGSLRDILAFFRARRGLLRASSILTVSEATRRDLQRIFSLPGDKIHVVYNALDERLCHRPAEAESDRVLSRYSAHDPYLLYAGNVKPHKNLPRLIEAFALVKDELREHRDYRNLRLIIIGDELSRHPQLRHAVLKSRTQSDVRFLGFVPPQTLAVFYTRAEAFVFPSLYEGFGLPPLEAMAHGAPVVTGNGSALREVLGEAALFVNPENVFEISRGIRQVLLDGKLRRRLVERGRERVKQFSWETSVHKVLEVYAEAARQAAQNW